MVLDNRRANKIQKGLHRKLWSWSWKIPELIKSPWLGFIWLKQQHWFHLSLQKFWGCWSTFPPNSNPRTLNKNSAILCFNQVQKEIMNANKYILKSWYFIYQFWSCWGVRSPRAARSFPLFAAPTALLPSTKTRPRSPFLISPLVSTFFSSFSSQHHFNPSSYSPISSSSFPSIYHSLFWCTPPG